jgi:hypothetical protein
MGKVSGGNLVKISLTFINMKKLPQALQKWANHLKTFRANNPRLTMKEAMKRAAKTYKK